MSINKRVVQLIEKTSISNASFSDATGISTVILSHISSGRNKVSLTAVEQILKAFVNVNADWLILGHGSMFKSINKDDKYQELEQHINLLKRDMEFYNDKMENKISSLQLLIDRLKSS
jgi:hypothetical protein